MYDFEHFDLDQVVVKANGKEFLIKDICNQEYDFDIDDDNVICLVDEKEIPLDEVYLYYGEDKQSDSIFNVIMNGDTSYDVYPESIAVKEYVLEQY